MSTTTRYPIVWQCEHCRLPITLRLDAEYDEQEQPVLVYAAAAVRAHMAQHRDA